MADGTNEISQSNPLSRKLNKILETRLDNDKDIVEALKALSTFFTENTLRSRRNLRGDIEKRSLLISENFEQAFGVLKEHLDKVYSDVHDMNKCCEDMTKRLQNTRDLIRSTGFMGVKISQKIQMMEKVADAFLSRFQLKQEEVEALRGARNTPVTEEFFQALARVREIHQDCKALLRTKQQTAGLEIMESMALHMEASYERLYRWTQDECRGLTSDLPDISPTLTKAMACLEDRPVLFKYCLDEYGTARRTAVVRCFIDALTRGGPGGTPRPIELHSHDPIRYVGDMLAWLHQAIASDKELLHSLLKNTSSGQESEREVLSHITEGISRPFKVRVEQVIVSEPGAVMLFSLANVLKFYGTTIGSILGEDAVIIVTVQEMNELALKMFFNSLNCHASKLLEKIELPPPDLGPTESLKDTLNLLRAVLTSHDASVVPLDARQADYSRLHCHQFTSGGISSNTPPFDMYAFIDRGLEMLSTQTDAHVDSLISEQASFILIRSGLGNVYSAYQENKQQKIALSSVHGLDVQSIKDAMTRFDKYLSSPDSLRIPQCELLRTTRLRDTVYKRAADAVCATYNTLYTMITDPRNNYTEPNSLVPRTPQQVTSLLT
ncbi:predicted protein [Nematostella vectensis]|uniref:Conserved oligomeric Golgi complex subunit 6 n=1 Tax=Nematostella vectensis TaxID=45351 RepID=A7SZM3_NEMVE|nr:predicted protein [Nematostella vectensis]|eukprot:XP_001622932.1 predicted protein [Nematostella vectensis]